MEERGQGAGVKRLVSAIRPSGPLHLGHYAGALALRQWLSDQHQYECYFMISDLQALATHVAPPEVIRESVREVALDWLAVGLDPRQNRFLVQSQIPELAELTFYLQMLVRTGELTRNPIVREEARSSGEGNLPEEVHRVDFGFLGFPVSQVADILIFTPTPPRDADQLIVPVGEDQLPHVTFAQQVAQRFNRTYGRVFLEPQERTAPVPRLPGTDGGAKMGKSHRTAIFLKETEEEYSAKIRAMFTDPLRTRTEDPGHPDGCPCFLFLEALGQHEGELSRRWEDCLLAKTDCADCREQLVAEIRTFLEPIQERRAAYEREPDFVMDVLGDGTRRARQLARTTMESVRDAMQLADPGGFRGDRRG
jgi:tryptophanyl-tRNA synthetase